jgi:hypothetical protein
MRSTPPGCPGGTSSSSPTARTPTGSAPRRGRRHRTASPASQPSIYFVAFDVDARHFDGVREAGGLVLPAANAQELTGTLDMLISGKILVER